MLRRAMLKLCGLAAVAPWLWSESRIRAAQAPLQRGMALGLFSEDALFSYGDLLREIRDLGASHVSFTVAYYQEHAKSTSIYEHPRFTAPLSTLARALGQAQDLGLRSMVFPIIRLERPRSDKEWRGTLAPSDAEAWWQSYSATMLPLCQLATRQGVSILSVGSELSTLDQSRDRRRWQALISRLRQEFSGLLLYSGNWDHYRDVGLYDLVDLAGLCGYFPLARRDYASPAPVEQLTEAWRQKRRELEQFAAGIGRPLVLTEVGYLSQRGAAAWPWAEGASEPVDLEDQRRCYAAFHTAWAGATSLRGVYFWNYYGWGGRASRGYTPRHKPAGQEIERYFFTESGRPAQ